MENIRLDESLSVQEFVKSLTGSDTVRIDASNIVISAYGQVQTATSEPTNLPNTQLPHPPQTQAITAPDLSD